MMCASTALQSNMVVSNQTNKSKFNMPCNFQSCLIIMLSAPRGVTRIAGANAYAAKLAISPTITVTIKRIKIKIKCSVTVVDYKQWGRAIRPPKHHMTILNGLNTNKQTD